MQYIPCNSALLAQETLFLTQKGTFLPKDLQKVSNSRQILSRNKIAYVRVQNFRPSPNFSAGAPRAPAQLLPPWCPTFFPLLTHWFNFIGIFFLLTSIILLSAQLLSFFSLLLDLILKGCCSCWQVVRNNIYRDISSSRQGLRRTSAKNYLVFIQVLIILSTFCD